MTRQLVRSLSLVLIALVMVAVSTVSAAPPANAQADVVGSADFRGAPILPPGEYRDTLVTGDTAWYALVYTNGAPYRFEVGIPGTNVASSSDLTLEATFVGPTFAEVGSPGLVVEGSGASYPSGHTNVWYLKVSLQSVDGPGTEFPISVQVEGVQPFAFENCREDDTCTLDDELAALTLEIDELSTEVEELRAQPRTEDVEAAIGNLEGFLDTSQTVRPAADARLAAAEAEIARLCAPEPTCETFPSPGSSTPAVGWVFGFLALIGGGYVALRKFQAPDVVEEEAAPIVSPRNRASVRR